MGFHHFVQRKPATWSGTRPARLKNESPIRWIHNDELVSDLSVFINGEASGPPR
jgi:hypothetical protein